MTGMSSSLAKRGLAAALLSFALMATGNTEEVSSTAQIDSLSWDIRVAANKATVKVYERTTVLKPAGEEFGGIQIWTSPLMTLNSFSGRVYDAEGKSVAKYGKDDLLKVCGFGSGYEVFNDECRFLLTPEHRTCPYTIESSQELEVKSLYLLPNVGLNARIPIKSAVIRLSFPSDQPVRYQSYKLAEMPEVTEAGDQQVVTWRLTNLPAVKEMSYTCPEEQFGRRIAIAADKFSLENFQFEGLTWKNVGLFMRKLSADPDMPRRVIGASVEPAVLKQRADSIYREVTGNTRYVAAFVGIGGWQPHPLAHIKQRLYGDCKDLSALLVSEFLMNGITAYPCLLMTNDEGGTDSAFVNFVFNHVITMATIGSDTLWYDPTCTHCPPGELRRDDEGVFVLACTDTGGVLVRTPYAPPQAHRITRVTDVTIDSVGRLALQVTATASGHFANSLRSALEHKDKKEIDQYVSDWLIGSRAHLRVTNYNLSNLDDITLPVGIAGTISCAQPIERLNQTRYFLPFLFTSRNVYSDIETGKRESDIWLGYPWEMSDTVRLHGSLVGASEQVTVPVDTTLTYPWVRINADYGQADSVVTAVLSQTYTADIVPAAQLGEFKSYIARRRWVVDQPIKFTAKGK